MLWGLFALMPTSPRLCSSTRWWASQAPFSGCRRNLLSPRSCCFHQWAALLCFPLDHGLCCSHSFHLFVSISCRGFMGLVRNNTCLSPLALKVSGGWGIQLVDGRLALQLPSQKGQRKRAWFLICCSNHRDALGKQNYAFVSFLSKLLSGLNFVCVTQGGERCAHERLSDSIVTIM